jgi:hypothetical protein
VFPEWYWQRLQAMVDFTAALMKPDGMVPQIGDQDSGRFVRFTTSASCEIPVAPEESRDHRHLLAVGGALFSRSDWKSIGERNELDGSLVTAGIDLAAVPRVDQSIATDANPIEQRSTEASTTMFPDAGVCILRSSSIRVTSCCRPAEVGAPTGHRHEDQLSFELNALGKDFIVDPGSGVYTADPGVRNTLRSSSHHNGIQIEGITPGGHNKGSSGLFSSTDSGWLTSCASTGSGNFTCEQTGHGVSIRRTFRVEGSTLEIQDELNGPHQSRATLVLHPSVTMQRQDEANTVILERDSVRIRISYPDQVSPIQTEPGLFSPHYGTTVATTRIIFQRNTRSAVVQFQIM